MGDDPDRSLGQADEGRTNRRQAADAGDGNTRRSFLGGALGGALAAGVGLGAVGTATAQVDSGQYAIECDHVRLTDASGIDRVDIEFADGSVVTSANGVSLHDADAVRLGSPGRTVTSVRFNGDQTVTNSDPCQSRHRATTFTATTVHVPVAEFMLSGSGDPPSVPSVLNSRVVLHFVDGTTETVMGYSGESDDPIDDFPEFPSVADRHGLDGIPDLHRGTGSNAGKVIEAIEIQTDLDYRSHYLRSDVADAVMLGAQSPQERLIEIVGTSQGAVEYELTATGPIRGVQINDRIGAGDNDTITENDDGTWTVSGFTGNTGYGDAFAVEGQILDITQTGGDGDYVVRAMERHVIDGSALSSASGGSVDSSSPDGASDDGSSDSETSGGAGDTTSHEIAVVATEQGEVSYEFVVDGTVDRASGAPANLAAEDNDTITENGDGTVTVSGYTGNTGYGDSYTVTGDLLSFDRTGGQASFRLELDGATVTADELVDSV